MALVLALTLLVLLSAHASVLPNSFIETEEAFDSQNVAEMLDPPETVEGFLTAEKPSGEVAKDGEPIALLIGKDVKQIRRKGVSDGKPKVRRRGHKDSLIGDILDHDSLHDPDDFELQKAIAQLLKEVAVREEKRKKKKGDIFKDIYNNNFVADKDSKNIKINQDDVVSSDEGIDDSQQDAFNDSIDDLDDADFWSDGVYSDEISKSNEIDLDDVEQVDSDYLEESDEVKVVSLESVSHESLHQDMLQNKTKKNRNRDSVEDEFANDDDKIQDDTNHSSGKDDLVTKELEEDVSEERLEKDSESNKDDSNDGRIVINSKNDEDKHVVDSHITKQSEEDDNDTGSLQNELHSDENIVYEEDDHDNNNEEEKDPELKEYDNLKDLTDENHDKVNEDHKPEETVNEEDHRDVQNDQQVDIGDQDIIKQNDNDELQQIKDDKIDVAINDVIDQEFEDEENNQTSESPAEKTKDENIEENLPNGETSKRNLEAKRNRQPDSMEIRKYKRLERKLERSRFGKRYQESIRSNSPIKSYSLSFFFKR